MNSIKTEHVLWTELCEDNSFFKEFKNVCEIGKIIWNKGWAEANAGNISLRLNDNARRLIEDYCRSLNLSTSDQFKIAEWYLISSGGSRLRDFSVKGFDCFNLVGVLDSVNDQIPQDIITIPSDRQPTSEWQSHIALQCELRKQNSGKRFILHAHPSDWIILSSLPIYRDNKQLLLNQLYECLPELKYYFKTGISMLTFFEAGSVNLAYNSVNNVGQSSIIVWERHGLVVLAEDAEQAFDYLEILAKAAEIYLKRFSLGFN